MSSIFPPCDTRDGSPCRIYTINKVIKWNGSNNTLRCPLLLLTLPISWLCDTRDGSHCRMKHATLGDTRDGSHCRM